MFDVGIVKIWGPAHTNDLTISIIFIHAFQIRSKLLSTYFNGVFLFQKKDATGDP